MKKLLALVFFAIIFVEAQAQQIGVYCDKEMIAPGEQIVLKFVVTGGSIQYFCYTDGKNVCLISEMEGNMYQEILSPREDTWYTITYVMPGSIDLQHDSVLVQVARTTFITPPQSCYDNDYPIYLLPHFWSNIPGYERLVEFDGPGVEGHYFYPSRSGGPGIKHIRAHITYNEFECESTWEIKVINGTGVDEDLLQEASVYPNPTYGLLYFQEVCDVVEIYSSTGWLLRKFNNITTIDISDLPSGMYMVRIFTECRPPTIRKIVKR